MIQLNKICKEFTTDTVRTLAIQDIDLSISRGEFVAVMGPSGCGKSTLLNIVGTLDRPTSGSYLLDGKEVGGLSTSQLTALRKGKIGFIFQSFNLIDELTVRQNVELPLTYLGISASERRNRVGELLERMNMSHRVSHYPRQLSGGQQQRVAIARALVTNPDIILADEPTGNLDSKNGIEVMELLTDLNAAGTTVMMVTHSDRDAAYAHRTITLFDGHITSSVPR
ncbi:MAG: ABC transporter ATP-binding protein [Muribaculaceae bacterium]|nr:ABC transporter ATP-binding protein [Muribaculaceae bacterium]MDE6093966.1 ABC transporter ATP-binding protein [Muribaculaceae bacterium]